MIGDTVCPTCGRKRSRSLPQNSRYWKLAQEMAEHSKEFTAEQFHEFWKRLYLPFKEVELPDWSTMLVPGSTAKLPMHRDAENPDKPNWDDYTMAVEKWCAERGVYLEDMT